MPQRKKKSTSRTTKTPTESSSMLLDKENYVLDPSTICAQWSRLWSSFGFNDHQWSSRAAKVEEYTRKLLEEKISTYKEQIVKRKQLLKQSIDDYEELISRTGLQSLIDMLLFDRLKLKEQENYLDRKMQELLINEGQLIQQRTDLENQQKQLCTLLNSSPIEFDENITISLVQINQKIEDHIKMLTDLKDLRLNQVSSYYQQVKEYSQRLDWIPPSPSTMENLLSEKFDLCLTADCLNEIETALHQLDTQIELQKARFNELLHQLQQLYERLNKNPNKDYCLAFRTGRENITAFVIKQLEEEIACCREERMKNGPAYRTSIQKQIADLLEKAHLGNVQKSIVQKLDTETLSSDLLDAYDAEYERLHQLYEKRKPVLDAYEKWLAFWNDFVAFTKASTDPGRFRTRGYNAEAETRKRKKYLQELPHIEEEFLQMLSEWNDPTFLIDNVPIRQKFDEAHHQVPSSALPTVAKTVATPQRSALTPVRSRTPAATPRRVAIKAPNVQSAARPAAKTPASVKGRKLLTKVASKTECQPKRAKPRAPPATHSSPPRPAVPLPVHPPAQTQDQTLDFSLLHTVKNIHGQIKIMTSTPNSSFDLIDNQNGKTAHNAIGKRKSKRLSKRVPIPMIRIEQASEETVVFQT